MNIHIPWVNEVSVCQTRSFSNLYLAEVMVAAIAAGNDGLLEQLRRYIGEFEALSKAADERIRHMLDGFDGLEKFVALGSGVQYGVVIEGAYITVEMAQQVAAYYGLLEFRHGPVVTADAHMLVCITHSGEPSYADKMAEETRAKGAKVAMICDVDRYQNKDFCFSLGHEACAEAVALYAVFVMQGIAYHRAARLGVNPDQPGDLVSWIAI
jgi:fructoselysine-6-P-deglycase FrlB-like protein